MDGGASWHGIREGHDVYFDAPQTSVAVRASLSGSGTTLHGLDITGVYEMNPLRFQVRLLRPVTAFGLTGGEYTVALPTVTTDSAAALTTQRLYVDGEWNSKSFTADLLPFEDDSAHTVTALGLDGEGRLHASGASASILLRTTLNATDLYETGRLELPGDTYMPYALKPSASISGATPLKAGGTPIPATALPGRTARRAAMCFCRGRRVCCTCAPRCPQGSRCAPCIWKA